jgi:hypothetical protein
MRSSRAPRRIGCGSDSPYAPAGVEASRSRALVIYEWDEPQSPVFRRVDGGGVRTLDGQRDGPSAKALMQFGKRPIPVFSSGVGLGAEYTDSENIGAVSVSQCRLIISNCRWTPTPYPPR